MNHPNLEFLGLAAWPSRQNHELEGIYQLSLKYPNITVSFPTFGIRFCSSLSIPELIAEPKCNLLTLSKFVSVNHNQLELHSQCAVVSVICYVSFQTPKDLHSHSSCDHYLQFS